VKQKVTNGNGVTANTVIRKTYSQSILEKQQFENKKKIIESNEFLKHKIESELKKLKGYSNAINKYKSK